jgi:nitrogen fixation NifU-like protein
MNEIQELYQELILDHSRRPRNFGRLEQSTHHAEGYNPLCGDRVTVRARIEGDTVRDIAFEGDGCAISKASASLMTESVKGKKQPEVEALFSAFHDLVTGVRETRNLGKLVAFSGLREFPTRVKCATLAWHTLRAALQSERDAVSTE